MFADTHHPTERQLKFRDQYRAQIHPLYSGPLHIGVIYVVGLSVIAWCVSRLQGATWEWLLVIPVFFLSNLFEWWIHKHVMHRLVDVWALRAIYDRHTRQHHQYFTDNEMTVSTTREWRIIFFPWRALVHVHGARRAVRARARRRGEPERRLYPAWSRSSGST